MIPVIYPNYYPHQTNYNKRNNVATIVTTKVGTFSSTWKGSGTLYFDPGDGGLIEPLVLTTGGVVWNHAYPSAGSKTIRITGDLTGVAYLLSQTQNIINSLGEIVSGLTNLNSLYLNNNNIIGNLSDISGLINLNTLYLHYTLITGDISVVSSLTNLNSLYLNNNNIIGNLSDISGLINLNTLYLYNTLITGDISVVSSLTNLVYLFLRSTSLSFTYTQFPPWSGTTYDLSSCISTSQEVGDLILAAANGGMNNCTYTLNGTNPVPPSTQEVTDAIATLAANGVTLYVST